MNASSPFGGMITGGGKPMHPMPVFAEDNCVQAIRVRPWADKLGVIEATKEL